MTIGGITTIITTKEMAEIQTQEEGAVELTQALGDAVAEDTDEKSFFCLFNSGWLAHSHDSSRGECATPLIMIPMTMTTITTTPGMALGFITESITTIIQPGNEMLTIVEALTGTAMIGVTVGKNTITIIIDSSQFWEYTAFLCSENSFRSPIST